MASSARARAHSNPNPSPEMPASRIERFLDQASIVFARTGPQQWAFQLAGEHKKTIPVTLTIVADSLRIESFFMRRPQDNREHFYELLLQRNARARGIAFALDADGDVYLTGAWPLAAIDERTLDQLLGVLLVEADGLFDLAIATGFETYLARDLAWRARTTPNP